MLSSVTSQTLLLTSLANVWNLTLSMPWPFEPCDDGRRRRRNNFLSLACFHFRNDPPPPNRRGSRARVLWLYPAPPFLFAYLEDTSSKAIMTLANASILQEKTHKVFFIHFRNKISKYTILCWKLSFPTSVSASGPCSPLFFAKRSGYVYDGWLWLTTGFDNPSFFPFLSP